ncbi:Ferritin-like metal-binding protein YciE [Paracoccus alcaliphilus]|uniref:Ferritin-like metal-binding protein YciE n=1 Tax=Paracoccus alcaliphilus TaxID=34002 RepID=A0A1H8NRX6_9RHOB|nr:ferritin-like domain-containing protein [Paracoccus alcaliphilus]WCR18709.1 ferritin-like domain-containing protein [Paracoccus alcaliphilus]SEO32133.1 Ferritin-like metal-binding protein YciE [Paracoccus alcaliphilus]
MEIHDMYLNWLRDAHAMEEQALTMLGSMSGRLVHYDHLHARVEQHIAETERQEKALRQLLERDSGTSLMKDLTGKAAATGQALGGVFASDEVVKGAIVSYAFEYMEIASYSVLIATARIIGDDEAIAVYEQNLAEEQSMANWLAQNMEATTDFYLRTLDSDGPEKRQE